MNSQRFLQVSSYSLSLLLLLLLIPKISTGAADYDSTSPYVHLDLKPRAFSPSISADDVITFSEFSSGTQITNQYQDPGIVFGGDSPFITSDGSNPTSPVLSGTPRFNGAIEGHFVDPANPATPAIVQSFQMDAGYFDSVGSTRLEWFDPDGNKLGQRTNTEYGIETFTIEGGNIASWRFEILSEEPQGFAIDNFSSKPTKSSIVFREKNDSEKEGTWGFAGDEIPGFDHCALNASGVVFESHPGYSTGTYVSSDGNETRAITQYNGVQAQHSKATFAYDSTSPGVTEVTNFQEIPIPEDLAQKMKAKIQTRIASHARFRFIDKSFPTGIEKTLSPSVQKGGRDNMFTCVGLVEWAAEQAGYRNGQGFIDDAWESIQIKGHTFPLLSPELLYQTLRIESTVDGISQWFEGVFDPINVVITDPLGRRLGYSDATGELNEIPNAFYTGHGDFEQFFIPNPIPGSYKVETTGVGQAGRAVIASSDFAAVREVTAAQGQHREGSFWLVPHAGSLGDLDGDGDVDNDDLALLQSRIPTFVNKGDPGDINGDGVLNQADVTLLQQLIAANAGSATPKAVIRSVATAVGTFSSELKKAELARQKSLKSLDDSLADILWPDENTLSKKGRLVFSKVRASVGYLNNLAKADPSLSIDAQSLIDQVRATAQRVAQEMVVKATQSGANVRRLASVQKHFVTARKAAGKGNIGGEIAAYGSAWGGAYKLFNARK